MGQNSPTSIDFDKCDSDNMCDATDVKYDSTTNILNFLPQRAICAIDLNQSKRNYKNIKQIEKQYNVDCGLTCENIDWNDNATKFSNFPIVFDEIKTNRDIEACIDLNLILLDYNNEKNVRICNEKDLICNVSDSQENNLHDTGDLPQETIIIPQNKDKWWVSVPVRHENGSIDWIQMLADPGANVGCVNTEFALKQFPKEIVKNNRTGVIKTPSGHVWPKYAVWLTFPCKSGLIYAARFLLLDKLPAPILADINMLRAFGYKFEDEVPPLFKHLAREERTQTKDLDIKMEGKYRINKPVANVNNLDCAGACTISLFENYRNIKSSDLMANYTVHLIDSIKCCDESIYTATADTDSIGLMDPKFAQLDHAINYLNLECIEMQQPNEFAATWTQTDVTRALQNLNQTNHAATLFLERSNHEIRRMRRLTMPEHDEEEERVMELDEEDPYHIYDVWKNRMERVEALGGDLDTRNHNLCCIINNIDPTTQDYDAQSTPKATFDSDIEELIAQFEREREQQQKVLQQRQHAASKLDSNKKTQNKPVKNKDKQVNFITCPNHILATPEEIEEAKKMHRNALLKFNDLKYLLKLEKQNPIKYKDLYIKTKKLIEKYKFRIFALHTYDRKTMKLDEPARLGIKEAFRNVTHYLEQYPLNKQKRLAMINETIELDRNGFWIPIETSQHNIPYTVIAKKPDATGHIRHRAAFDARTINQYCELIKAAMPTMRNFDDFFARPGLITLADFKNFFDCLPLDPRDWKYAVVQTPLGLRMMKHCSYGWKNSAPNAQNQTNSMSAKVPGMMGYIDDIAIKHKLEDGTDQLIDHLEQFFKVCEEYNVLLHPEKFFPFATEVESLGIKRTSEGSELTAKYKKKVLGLKKPENTDELRAAIGVIQYIGRYIYMYSMFAYWLVILINEFEGKPQIKWTEEANYAWDRIMDMVQAAPILYHPTTSGQFCIKCDGCPYAVGAVLYQWQQDQTTGSWRWVIVDMFSKIIPQSQRFNHCIISEALAILWPAQHWVVHLLRAPFIIATDHKALIKVFSDDNDLSSNAQKQLLRIRLGLADFTFEIRHVRGIDNALPDQLSRLGAKLFELSEEHPIKAFKGGDIKNARLTGTEIAELNEKIKELQTKSKHLKKYKQFYGEKGNITDGINKYFNDACNLSYELNRNIIETYKQPMQSLLKEEIARDVNSDNLNYNFDKLAWTTSDSKSAIKNISQNAIETMDELMHTCTTRKLLPKHKYTRNKINQTLTMQAWQTNDEFMILNGYMTRSKTKLAQNEYQKHSFIEPDDNEINKRQQYRQTFLDLISSHRAPIYFFEPKKFREFQRNDDECTIIYKHLKNDMLFERDEHWKNRWDDFQKYENDTYKLLKRDLFRINEITKLIEIRQKCDLDNQLRWLLFVPVKLRLKILEYAHHNPYSQHFGIKQTYCNLTSKFWWPDVKYDTTKFVESCLVCLYIKGGPNKIAPLIERPLPEARDHLMADFLQYEDNNILVIMDYRTGYVMLRHTNSTGSRFVADMILEQWVPIMGWFTTFESDYGSAFYASLIKRLFDAVGVESYYSEPRNHQGTGRVEAKIKFIQQILNAYNVESGGILADPNRRKRANNIIKALLPFIQFSLNQTVSRFTTFSPNMLMFGTQLAEIVDVTLFVKKLKNSFDKNDRDYEYVSNLIKHLRFVHRQFKKDWKHYIYVSKENHRRKYNIDKRHKYSRKYFQSGKKVMYYIGDKAVSFRKWQQRWTGPWNVVKRVNERTLIISDSKDGAMADVSIDRCKPYRKDEMYSLAEYDKLVQNRNARTNKLLERGNFARKLKKRIEKERKEKLKKRKNKKRYKYIWKPDPYTEKSK